MFDVATGQVIRSFKRGGEFGDPIKVSNLTCSTWYQYSSQFLTNLIFRLLWTQVVAMWGVRTLTGLFACMTS